MNEVKLIMKNGKQIYPDLPDGCLGYWYFTEQSNTDEHRAFALDVSGENNHGTHINKAWTEQSGYDDGLVYDGIDDYTEFGAILEDRRNVTFFAAIENYQGGAIFAEELGAGFGYGFTQTATHLNFFRYNTSGVPRTLFYIAREILVNKSFSLCITVQDHVAKMYLDGVLYLENNNVDMENINAIKNIKLYIGRGGNYTSTYYADYKTKRAGVWSRALAEDEVEYISSM